MSELRRTALYELHMELGARMVPFAGYEMPVQYPLGVLKEHLHTRNAAGLFDVSHMGQVRLSGNDAPRALESLVPVDIVGLPRDAQRYALFTDESGGILDDLMVTNLGDALWVVVNAACKENDIAHLRHSIGARCEIVDCSERALLALQGPAAHAVMARLAPGVDFASWLFMGARSIAIAGVPCLVTRSGYTGEDGFEISLDSADALRLARAFLGEAEVQPIGLGARDSLRLEAGLCLYGQDIDSSTSPIDAGLAWAVSKARRSGGARPGGFPGAEAILGQMLHGSARRRVGLAGLERTPVRAGAVLVDQNDRPVGSVTSGGFGPSVNGVVAMGYVPVALAAADTPLWARVRERKVPMRVVATPFFPQRYYRGRPALSAAVS